MRILILGGDGMLGHQLLKHLRPRHKVKVTLRQDFSAYIRFGMFNKEDVYDAIDIRSLGRITEVMADFRPQAVINAVGIVKQRPAAKDCITSLEVNALLPHRLAVLCKGIGARLIHLSTDCIFSGKKGSYVESDPSDAEDLYGRTKYLGEIHEVNSLTLRTSIIGRELSRHTSLLDWFLSQSGAVKGFTKAIYTGFTTLEMSRIIEMMLESFPDASGIYQVSSDPISKYELLLLIKKILKHQIEVIPEDGFFCDRSLDSSRFRAEFNYIPPTWPAMVEELRI
ncbi:SDR family oxidoreductase [Polaromonas sp. C04]|uniref:dTDP-4-dehydrorhamnose reductase family protein n=1 Tax=Polaromonas sp. C04 TaxID=1945857 RepID=UPI000986574F|nr:SDR family oxidoreductase [Polaromonas sp. C04]OOG50598.1 NAD(P)-dependent oxidoreductase [Polaromonas sp. C04]